MKTISNSFLQKVLILAMIAPCIEVDISVPGFPDISDYFNISDGMTQMTVVYNFYGLVLACMFQGPLADSFGRRSMILIGNIIMTIGAIGCATAESIEFLYASRFIQGFGASSSMVLTTAIVADRFEGKDAARLYGVIASVMTILMATAPVIGSFINETIGWRGNYSVVALISALSSIFIYAYLPETLKEPTKLNLVKSFRDYSKIFTTIRFWIAALIPSLNYAGYLCFVTIAPFLYMEAFNLYIGEYALHQAIIVLSFSLTSMKTGSAINRFGEVGTVYLGVFLCVAGGALMSAIGFVAEQSPYLVTLAMMLFAAGAALSRNVPFAKAMGCYPEMKGTTSSAMIALRMSVISVIMSITSGLFNGKVIIIGYSLTIIGLCMTILAVRMKKSFTFQT